MLDHLYFCTGMDGIGVQGSCRLSVRRKGPSGRAAAPTLASAPGACATAVHDGELTAQACQSGSTQQGLGATGGCRPAELEPLNQEHGANSGDDRVPYGAVYPGHGRVPSGAIYSGDSSAIASRVAAGNSRIPTDGVYASHNGAPSGALYPPAVGAVPSDGGWMETGVATRPVAAWAEPWEGPGNGNYGGTAAAAGPPAGGTACLSAPQLPQLPQHVAGTALGAAYRCPQTLDPISCASELCL